MPYDLTHASFFSGVGGLDIGLERAGWRTVSFSEIDPYASAVLTERWPGVPNLGDITAISNAMGTARHEDHVAGQYGGGDSVGGSRAAWTGACLWTGGFPCQDLSVAGKRRGFAGERSVLAFAFLDLVERHRPPAILLENVPGLLSSNAGKDFGALLGRLAELGYWWAYRVLDAQFFGVPQRRRRVFICALHAGADFGADSPAEVLSVGARCGGHSASGDEAGTRAAFGLGGSPDLAGSLTRRYGKGVNSTLDDGAIVAGTVRSGGHGDPGIGRDGDERRLIVRSAPDSGGVREADGLAGRVDHREVVAVALRGRETGATAELGGTVANSLRGAAGGGSREHVLAPGDTVRAGPDEAAAGQLVAGVPHRRLPLSGVPELLPLGLDSHRYRCCGNGVVAPVSEWIGWRIRAAIEANAEVAA